MGLLTAIINGDVNKVYKHCTPEKANKIYDRQTVLSNAVIFHEAYDSREIMQILLDRGADINGRDDDGRTPLHNAFNENLQLYPANGDIGWLLHHGADINAIDNEGCTILLTAYDYITNHDFRYKTPIFEELLKAGGNPYVQNNNGWSVFHAIFDNDDVQIFKFFFIYVWKHKTSGSIATKNDDGCYPWQMESAGANCVQLWNDIQECCRTKDLQRINELLR